MCGWRCCASSWRCFDGHGLCAMMARRAYPRQGPYMDNTYGRAVALAVPVFISLIALEFILDRVRGTRYYHLADSLNSLSCGIVSTGMRVFFAFLGVFSSQWVLLPAPPFRFPAGHWLTWLFAFVAYDLCYYWQPRLGH